MVRRLLVLVPYLLTAGAAVHAQPITSSVSAPTAAFEILGIQLAVNHPLAMLRAIRVLHSEPPDTDTPKPHAVELDRLLDHLDRVERELARAGRRDLSLAMAKTNTERRALENVLEAMGLRLREQRRTYSVTSPTGRLDTELRARLRTLEIDATAIQNALNAGETVRIAPGVVDLPLPLPVAVWTEVVFGRPVPPQTLFGAIVRNREASLLYHGVQAMTSETRAYLSHAPDLVRSLLGDAAAVGAFGSILRIEGGRIVMPGGTEAAELWEELVNDSLAEPSRFARRLFSRDAGRLAYFVDALGALDDAHLRFALGLSISDRGVRLNRFRDLYQVFADIDPQWTVADRPFARPPHDAALLLSMVSVTPQGELAAPAFRKLWARAVASIEIPGASDRDMRDPEEDGRADAAFLATLLREDLFPARRVTIERIGFAQRVFAGADPAALQNVLVALRAYGRFPALMRTLERMGTRNPAVYALIARHAQTLETEEPARAVTLLAQFQGALVILDRLARTGTVAAPVLESLLLSTALIAQDGGRYRGRLSDWISSQLLPALQSSEGTSSREERLLVALSDRVENARPFSWEGGSYVVDFAPLQRDLRAVRSRQGGNTLDALLTMYEHARALSVNALSLDEIKARAARVRSDAAALTPARAWPDAPADVRDVKRIIDRAVRDLGEIRRERDIPKAPRIAESIVEAMDHLLGEMLAALAYALVADPSRMRGPTADISRRHTFGFNTEAGGRGRLVPWQHPVRGSELASGEAVTGSLLGLDLAMARNRLRRIAAEGLPESPRLNNNERETMTETLALLNPRLLDDEGLARISEAVTRGRSRVEQAAADASALDALAVEGRIAPERRQLLSWVIEHDRQSAVALFSIRELFRLGGGAAAGLDPFGTTQRPLTGCYCARVPDDSTALLVTGRPSTGQMSAALVDLNLRVAELLGVLNAPAALFPNVMAMATQEYIDSVPAAYHDDWSALAGRVAAVSRERVEDYVSAVVANGPVRPASAGGGGQ
jgi:hypothetical protein